MIRRKWSTAAALMAVLFAAVPPHSRGQQPAAKPPAITLAQHDGKLTITGLHQPVEVLRDRWGVPHIYARDTHDLFFAQGFVAAQDHLWQMELWRRNGEGKLAEVLGPEYAERDRFARLIAFHGDWDAEMRKYHPEGPVIFTAFADGINRAIRVALDSGKVPIEFQWMGFQPDPSWTAQTVLGRMPAWILSGNAQRELARALAIKTLGMEKAADISVTDPFKALAVPGGLNLDDISPRILDIARGASDFWWKFSLAPSAAAGVARALPWLPPAGFQALVASTLDSGSNFDLGSNNWVIGPSKSATKMPILANDPHREIQNPALRMLVHLTAPGWDAIGATEPGMPGISIGHNDNVAWGFTILGVDLQDIYVEETDPANPQRYLHKGQWLTMESRRELIQIKGRRAAPEIYEARRTIHGPVLYEDTVRHRAYSLRWVGDEAGSAGYLGSLNVMQAKNWTEFTRGVEKSWYLPSHSLVYADKQGHYGYMAAALSPIRKNWDGLLPVPGKDGEYEWQGFVPLATLPRELDGKRGFYASANNDVLTRLFPDYKTPLGYEYSAPYRYERIDEVLSENRKFTVADMQALQQDELSIPARRLVPLLRGVQGGSSETRAAIDRLLAWNFVVSRDGPAPAIYEYFLYRLSELEYAARLPAGTAIPGRGGDIRRVLEWTSTPGPDRDRLLLQAVEEAIGDLKSKYGADPAGWKWGTVHRALFLHPLLAESNKSILGVAPISRGGDAYTVHGTGNAGSQGADQIHGASAMLILDTGDWDRSVAMNAPGNESQAGSRHAADLAPLWGNGKYFPLAYSREKVEEATESRLKLYPAAEHDRPGPDDPFERVETDFFTDISPVAISWGDYDNDGWPDLAVAYRGGYVKLYRNDHGHFTDVSLAAGFTDRAWPVALSWGDFDGDGFLDLYVGYAYGAGIPNRLYHNDGHGHFVDVAAKMGVDDWGETRQVSFIDFNNDGRLDLFVAFRDKQNRLYRNDGDHFTEVAQQMGLTGAHSTVGAVWFDYNEDGRLDLFEANQSGALNRVYRNDGDRFTDVAKQLGMDGAGRSPEMGSVGIAVADYNNDGRLDLYFANYGPSWLMRNDGGGKFTDVAPDLGVAVGEHLVSAGWGDYDNDGRPDLYTDGYLVGHEHIPDFLFHNEGSHFTDVTPGYMLKHDADHAVVWADFNLDGAIDLALADHEGEGVLNLYRNRLPAERARRSISVLVLDAKGHYTRAGSEVRVYKAGTREVLGARLVDTGSGYNSQSALPVHIGLPNPGKVDVEVTYMSGAGRRIARVTGVDAWARRGKPIIVKTE